MSRSICLNRVFLRNDIAEILLKFALNINQFNQSFLLLFILQMCNTLPGKRSDITACQECCDSDFCNYKGCNEYGKLCSVTVQQNLWNELHVQ